MPAGVSEWPSADAGGGGGSRLLASLPCTPTRHASRADGDRAAADCSRPDTRGKRLWGVLGKRKGGVSGREATRQEACRVIGRWEISPVGCDADGRPRGPRRRLEGRRQVRVVRGLRGGGGAGVRGGRRSDSEGDTDRLPRRLSHASPRRVAPHNATHLRVAVAVGWDRGRARGA